MSLQATAGDKCIFKADFTSGKTVVDQGGVITGVPTIDHGLKCTVTNSQHVLFPGTGILHRSATNISWRFKFKTPPAFSAVSSLLVKWVAGQAGLSFTFAASRELRLYLATSLADAGSTYGRLLNIVASTEYDLSLVYDGAGATNADKLKAYVNGVATALSFAGPAIPATLTSSTADYQALLSTQSLAGTAISDLAIYSKSLTAEEAKDLYEHNTIPEIDRPLIDLPLRSWYYKENGTELLTDGDMEAAGTASWVANSSALSKQTTNPHGGSRCLRITAVGGSSNPYFTQAVLTAGRRYKISGYVRSNGTTTPLLSQEPYAAIWVGTTSTSWQSFSVEFIATGTTLRFYGNTTTTADLYSEFDDINIQLMEAYTENKGTSKTPAKLGDGTTTTKFPTQLTPHGMNFDGGDYLRIEPDLNPVSNRLSIAIVFNPSFTYDEDAQVYLYGSDSTSIFAAIKQNDTYSNTLDIWMGNEKVASVASATYGQYWRKGCVNTLIVSGKESDGATGYAYVWLNGILISTTTTEWHPAAVVYMLVGASYSPANYFTGKIYNFKIFHCDITAQQASILRTRLLKEINI